MIILCKSEKIRTRRWTQTRNSYSVVLSSLSLSLKGSSENGHNNSCHEFEPLPSFHSTILSLSLSVKLQQPETDNEHNNHEFFALFPPLLISPIFSLSLSLSLKAQRPTRTVENFVFSSSCLSAQTERPTQV